MNNQIIYLRNIINGNIAHVDPLIRNGERIVDIVQNIFHFQPDHIIRQGGEILDINTNINDVNAGDNIYAIHNRDIEIHEGDENNYEEEMNILYNMGIATNNNNELVLDLLRTNNGNIELVINTLV